MLYHFHIAAIPGIAFMGPATLCHNSFTNISRGLEGELSQNLH